MTNKEITNELELKLKNKTKKRKLIKWIFVITFILCVIIFSVLFNESKEVVVYGENFTWEVIEYNEGYILGIVFSVLGLISSIILLVIEYLFCKYGTVETKGHYITVFKTLTKNTVYINGELNSKIYSISMKFHHQIKLPNDVGVSIIFLPFPLRLARFSFEDDTPTVEL